MKQLTINWRELLLVEVPEDAQNIEYHDEQVLRYITFHTGMGTEDYDILRETLPSSDWRILGSGKADAITEDEWKEVVDGGYNTIEQYKEPEDLDGWELVSKPMGKCWRKITKVFYADYTAKQPKRAFHWVGNVDTATASGHSLLSLHGFSPSITVVLIKK